MKCRQEVFILFLLLHLRYGWAISLSFRGVCVCVRLFLSSFRPAWVLNLFGEGSNKLIRWMMRFLWNIFENWALLISDFLIIVWKSCYENNLFLISLIYWLVIFLFIYLFIGCFGKIVNKNMLNEFCQLCSGQIGQKCYNFIPFLVRSDLFSEKKCSGFYSVVSSEFKNLCVVVNEWIEYPEWWISPRQ